MASTVTAATEDFARRMFQVVEELSGQGAWVGSRDAFEQTVAAHPEHPYVAYISGHRARKAGLSAVAERIREHEFPHVERRKQGTRRNAPVLYRVGGPGVSLDLQLPYVTPPSHPLLSQRRHSGEDGTPLPARLQALTDPGPKSVWRRRLGARWRNGRDPGKASNGRSRRFWAQLRLALDRLLSQLRPDLSR